MPPIDARSDQTVSDHASIHIPGAIQPFGFLLAVSGGWAITYVSANFGAYLPWAPKAVLGRKLVEVLPPATVHALRGAAQTAVGAGAVERRFRLPLRAAEDAPLADFSLYILDDRIIIEAEPSADDNVRSGITNTVLTMLARLQRSTGIAACVREAARQARALTGYDRVMIYRFDEDGEGEVIAESLRSGAESFLGLRYPAVGMPPQARALYERSWLRLTGDVDAAPVPLLQASPEDGPLDLSLAAFRVLLPMYGVYLRRIGVAASLSISILCGGRLWGLIVCHAQSPAWIGCECRTALEIFGQMFSLLLESRERAAEQVSDARVRRLRHRLLPAVRTDGPEALGCFLEEIASVLPCDGAAAVVDGRVSVCGAAPEPDVCAALAERLHRGAPGEIRAEARMSGLPAAATCQPEQAAGVLAVPLSIIPGGYLLFFRRETVRQVILAGQPDQTAGQSAGQAGPEHNGSGPRQGAAARTETAADGRSRPWTEADRRAAAMLRAAMLDVLLYQPGWRGEEGGPPEASPPP